MGTDSWSCDGECQEGGRKERAILEVAMSCLLGGNCRVYRMSNITLFFPKGQGGRYELPQEN